MVQMTDLKEIEQLIADQLELCRGAETWSPFIAIAKLTTHWIIDRKPTRKKLIDSLLVNPEQLFNVVMFHENSSSMGHNRTWSQLAVAHLYVNREMRDAIVTANELDKPIDGTSILSKLVKFQVSKKICSRDTTNALNHLRSISYSSRLPESFKKKAWIHRITF